MKGKWLIAVAMCWFSSAMLHAQAVPAAAPTNSPPLTAIPSDLLQFVDGSSLHGKLRTMRVDQGITWEHPDAKSLIQFKPSNLGWIRFEKPVANSAPAKPGCRFRFNNGDEVFGSLSSIDQENVEMQTWFGGPMKTPRQSVQSVTFLSKGYSILYEGPNSPDGWVHGKNPRGWEYRDGAFVATGAGTLGRDFGLSGSSSVAFDLSWNGQFSLILALYTPVLDRFDYSASSYMFYLSPGYISLQRVQGGAGAMNLGQAQILEMTRKNKLRMEIRANKEDSTLGLLVDDRLVQRWKDSAGFVGQGSGAVFFAQLDGPSIRISNIKVAQWEGEFGLDSSTNAPTKEDLVYLVNRDKVPGQVQSLKNGTLSMVASQTSLAIPLERVSQICLGSPVTNSLPSNPWELRAYFTGGGTVAFQLEDWKEDRVSGKSGNFGAVAFDPHFIRQLQFNLNRPKLGVEEVEILDGDVWDMP